MNIMMSYRSKDRAFVDELDAYLLSGGVKAWLDHEMIQPGSQWRGELLNQLRECDACIPILSQSYLESEHCKMELLIARSFGRRIIPIMLDDCWSELHKYEATRGLADIFILQMYDCNFIGLPIDRGEAFRRIELAAHGHKVNKTRHIYISFLQNKAPIATNISEKLNERGIPTWIATKDSIVGENWRNAQVRAMNDAVGHLVLLQNGITENEFLRMEMLMSEAVGVPVYTAHDPALLTEPGKVERLNDELRGADLTYRRVFDRHAFSVSDEEPVITEQMIKMLKSETARKWLRWPSITK